MKKDIYSNIKNADALENFFECITHCSINREGVKCATACYAKHLKAIESSQKEIYLVKNTKPFKWEDSFLLNENFYCIKI